MKGVLNLTDIVCLMSGGIDSSLSAALVLEETECSIWPLYILRGASAEKYEILALNEILIWLKEKYGSKRIHPLKTFQCFYPPIELKEKYPTIVKDKCGYVGREVVLSHLAIFYALSLTNENLKFGVTTGSLSEDLFPHNSISFWDKLNSLVKIELGDYAINIINPLQGDSKFGLINKKRVIQIAQSIGLPISKTRSCISSNEIPCGICLECIQRNFAENEALHV